MGKEIEYDARIIEHEEHSLKLAFLNFFGTTKNSLNHYLEIKNEDTKGTKRFKIGRTDYWGSHDPLNKEPDTWDEYYSGAEISYMSFTKEGLRAKIVVKDGRSTGIDVLDRRIKIVNPLKKLERPIEFRDSSYRCMGELKFPVAEGDILITKENFPN